MANASGGIIVIGLRTHRIAERSQDMVDAVHQLATALINPDSYLSVIEDYVHPHVNGIHAQWWAGDPEKGLLTIQVPRQDGTDKYFVVYKSIIENAVHGALVGVFIRDRDRIHHLPPAEIHGLIKAGRSPAAALPESQLFETLDPVRSSPMAEVAEKHLYADLEAAGLENDTFIFHQAWPGSPSRIHAMHASGAEGLKQRFFHPPQLRPFGGFNLGFGDHVETIAGGGMRKSWPESISLSVQPDGLLTLIVGSEKLSWGMKEGSSHTKGSINPTALIELTAEFIRLYSKAIVPRFDPAPKHHQFRMGLRNLSEDSIYLLPRGLPDAARFTETEPIPQGQTEVTVEYRTEKVDAESVTHKLLQKLYQEFGIGPEDIPYAVDGRIVFTQIEEIDRSRI